MKQKAPVYVLIGPPISPFSTPDEIRAWIETLHAWESDEDFQYENTRETLNECLREAEGWLEHSLAPDKA